VIEAGLAESVQVGAGGVGVTVTVTEQCAVPPGPVAVPVKVAVCAKEANCEPAGDQTEPIPWSMERTSALVMVHASMNDAPAEMVSGLAESVHEGAGGWVTATVAKQCAVPPTPVAVPVYVTVAAGETDCEPLPIATVPTPWSIENDTAFIVVHERAAELPVVIEAGLAESEQVGAGNDGGGMMPPPPGGTPPPPAPPPPSPPPPAPPPPLPSAYTCSMPNENEK